MHLRRAGAAVGLALLLHSFTALAEGARPTDQDRWAFVQAWGVFRRDIDATVPGEHGGVYLIERVPDMPAWLEHDAIRVATAPPVTSYLARRLARRGDGDAIPALRAALEAARSEASRRALERALVRLGDAELRRQVARRLRAASSPERWRAAATLAAAGDEATPDLRAALEDPDGQTRLVAATALATRGDRRAKALLVRHLSSTNPFERVEAAHGLALAGEARGVPVLRKVLSEPGAGRPRAARSLGRVGGGLITVRLSLPVVQRYLGGLDDEEDDEHGVRAVSLAAIGRAVAEGATERPAIAARVAAELEATLAGETPVAAARRRELVRPLSELLAGRSAGASAPAPRPYSRAREARALAVRGGNPAARIDRFVAAAQILEHVGATLGHPAHAEAPAARATGLGADRALDGSPLTAWIAGPMAGSLRIDLPRPRTLRTLHVMGGCVDSRASYRAHARVRQVRVRLDGGAPITARLVDGNPYFQEVDLGGARARRLELEVTEVYPGGRRGAPACVPELRLE